MMKTIHDIEARDALGCLITAVGLAIIVGIGLIVFAATKWAIGYLF